MIAGNRAVVYLQCLILMGVVMLLGPGYFEQRRTMSELRAEDAELRGQMAKLFEREEERKRREVLAREELAGKKSEESERLAAEIAQQEELVRQRLEDKAEKKESKKSKKSKDKDKDKKEAKQKEKSNAASKITQSMMDELRQRAEGAAVRLPSTTGLATPAPPSTTGLRTAPAVAATPATTAAPKGLLASLSSAWRSFSGKKRWRDDLRCGLRFPGEDGKMAAECNPGGPEPCCSPSGWCGSTPMHCFCEGCKDFRETGEAIQIAGDGTYDQKVPKNIALVVPFRDREAHLQLFRERIRSHVQAWNEKGVVHNWTVFVVEQFNKELFNRGYLFNVGFQDALEYSRRTGRNFDCVVMHDIDIIPEPVVDYGWCLWPIQLSSEIECWGWTAPYPDNVGGVVSLSPDHWKAINGFANDYHGWGGEDDDLYYRLRQNGLLKGDCHTWCNEKITVPTVKRPALGTGRFNCLHDGDHTPRRRSENDKGMWKMLNHMKKDGKRWKSDGLRSLQVNVVTQPFASFEATEGPNRKRLFGEQWTRVSMQPIKSLDHVRVRLAGSLATQNASCAEASVPLLNMPRDLSDFQRQLPSLFGEGCVTEAWASKATLVMVDLMKGSAYLTGDGVVSLRADGSLPPLDASGQRLEEKQVERVLSPTEQSQRLIRWLRDLPQDTAGWIIATDVPMGLMQERFRREVRMMPQITPVCISEQTPGRQPSAQKFRATSGTTWCGDQGWSTVSHFHVLRAGFTVAADRRMAVCVAVEEKTSKYRFDQSETGCIGTHKPSGTVWKHVFTMHTSKDANGDRMCVGVASAAENTRWMMMKSERCDYRSFKHSFSFSAQLPPSPVLVRTCLLEVSGDSAALATRLAVGESCGALPNQDKTLKVLRDMWFLREARTDKDERFCLADGVRRTAQAQSVKVWRAFWNTTCAKGKTPIADPADPSKAMWSVREDPAFYAPAGATGPELCLCALSDQGQANDVPIYSWSTGDCPSGARKEKCIRELSPDDMLRYTQTMDELL